MFENKLSPLVQGVTSDNQEEKIPLSSNVTPRIGSTLLCMAMPKEGNLARHSLSGK